MLRRNQGAGASLPLVVFILISSPFDGKCLSSFRKINLACPPKCVQNGGNCNHEFGRCECRFGFGGDDCSRPLLPACMSSLRPSAVPQYGNTFPKNCLCYRQLMDLVCTGPFWKDPVMCEQPVFWSWDSMRCYEYKRLPEDKQLSDPPAKGDSRVVWKKGRRNITVEGPGLFMLEEDPQPGRATGNDNLELLPQDRCKDRCQDRGRCVDRFGRPACICAPFYTGDSCESVDASHCPLACSGRGICDGGFCRCEPGYWGAGCTRSTAYTSEEWTPHPTELKIYVYDMPETVTYMRPIDDDWPMHYPIYLAEIDLYHRLLGDTKVRTENPWEANLFFVPTYSYYFIGNVGFGTYRFTKAFSHVRDTYPWWNMTAGRNHFVALSNDRGACDIYRKSPELQHPIKLVHFAQAPRQGVPLWKGGPTNIEWSEVPESLAQRLTTSMEDPAMLAAMAEFQHLAGRPRFKGFPVYQLAALHQEREQCFRPEHDVAFPPYIARSDEMWGNVLHRAYKYLPNGRAMFRRESRRDVFFHFNGFSKQDMSYSAGVRQGFLALFENSTRPGLDINKGGGPDHTLRSVFCFTPMGFGWGIRLTQALYTGCIPVMTHDHVWPTLWDVLPYERFSVRVSRHNLHRLFDYLDAITPEQIVKMQDALAEVHKAFVWQPELGGQAYEHTLLSLHRKLLNMWTAFF